MGYSLIDTHVHLDELENVDLAFEEAREKDIIAIVAVGSGYESNTKILKLAQKHHSFVFPALGLHPWQLTKLGPYEVDNTLDFIEQNITAAVAVGEIGLDYHKRLVETAPKELQKEVLLRLLTLAKRFDKPVIIHSRYAWKDTFLMASEAGLDKAVFHWFTGSATVLNNIINRGYFISATPAAEYHEEHRRAVKAVPLEHLILETDSPVTYGVEARYRASPADVVRSLRAVTQLIGVNQAIIAEKTTQNAISFFSLQGINTTMEVEENKCH
jgi:TatD DNase family protein